MSGRAGQIEVHLYGALRRRAPCREVSSESVVWVEVYAGDTVADAIRRLDIADGEVSNVFRNGRLAAADDVIQTYDRLGVFPSNMSLLYC